MIGNIDSQINDRMQMYSGNPQALQQRYAQTQELVDLLALQKMKNDRAAATNAVQGAMQTDTSTYKGRLEQEAMQGARSDVLRSMAPGFQQQGQRMAQMQNRAAVGMPTTGLPTQAAPNMNRMANGGIVGYAGPDGSKVEATAPQMPVAGQTQNPSPGYLDPAVATFLRELEKLNKQLDAAFPQEKDLFEQKITDLINTTSPRVKRIASDSQFGLPKKDGMAQGGIVGYNSRGSVNLLEAALEAEGITDPATIALIRSIYAQESSSGQNTGVSPAGARGPMQVMPGTFTEMMGPDADINDPMTNLRAGSRYAQQMLARAEGDPRLAAAGYYGGRGGMNKLRAGNDVIAPQDGFPNISAYADEVVARLNSRRPPAIDTTGAGDLEAAGIDPSFYASTFNRGDKNTTSDVPILDESRFGVTTDRGMSPEQARTQDSKRKPVDRLPFGSPEFLARQERVGETAKEDVSGILNAFVNLPSTVTGSLYNLATQPNAVTRLMQKGAETSGVAPFMRGLGAPALPTPDPVYGFLGGDAKPKEADVPGIPGVLNDMPQPSDAQRFANAFPGAQAVVDQYAEEKDSRDKQQPKGGSDIDFRALREFLTAGGGQTSTAGALGAGARGLGAYQAAEQGRQDKINKAAAELTLKRDLAINEARMLDRRLLADYKNKLATGELKLVQDILEQLNDPFSATGKEYQAKADVIREKYERNPVERETALRSLKDKFLGDELKTVRQTLGGAPTTSAAITDMGLE